MTSPQPQEHSIPTAPTMPTRGKPGTKQKFESEITTASTAMASLNNSIGDQLSASTSTSRAEHRHSHSSKHNPPPQMLYPEETEITSWHHVLDVLKSNHLIWILPCLLFVALASCGSVVIWMHFDTTAQHQVDEAHGVANEAGLRFQAYLDQAMTPLFSLAQFVHELNIFHDLPDKVGDWQQPGSLPNLPDKPNFRNVTGVCDNPVLKDRFEGIAGSIKHNAQAMQGVLVNLQLVPDAVVCLVHPLVNTEDFPPGMALNSSGAIGHDLLADPQRRFDAERSLKSGELAIVGPISLVQCDGCDPIVEQAFIARLPILMEGHHMMTHDNLTLPQRWGFAVALINWKVLVEKTYLHEEFALRNWAFQLTRLDKEYDEASQDYVTSVVVLDETPDFQDKFEDEHNYHHIETQLDTTDSQWTLSVVYSLENAPTWRVVSLTSVIVVSFLMSILTGVVLFQKQLHSELIKVNLQRAERSAQTERDLNDFIAHEIRNPLSAAMAAATFLATTVESEQQLQQQENPSTAAEERQSLLSSNGSPPAAEGDEEEQSSQPDATTAVSSINNKSTEVWDTMSEDVSIINSSLSFINDLLRNMLDMHRAASRQMVLVPVETDILKDILEPVAAMLHNRDKEYQVQVEMDPNLPSPLILMVDRLRLQQVILNLGRNAAKFTSEGSQGFVRLKAELGKSGFVELVVEDNGQGVPASKRPNLFRRYQESLDSLSQGTGVGLCLCQTLVEDLMGGELYLDETYHSGLEGCPGARLVVHLKGFEPILQPPVVDDLDEVDINQLMEGSRQSRVSATRKKRRKGHKKMNGSSRQSQKSAGAADARRRQSDVVSSTGEGTNAVVAEVETGLPVILSCRDLCNYDDDDDQSEPEDSNGTLSSSCYSDQTRRPDELPASLSILFVDDERILRKLAIRAFAKLAPGWTVDEQASGEAAMQLMCGTNKKHYDLVFLDQYFTSAERRLTGTETTRAMRAKGIKSIICGVSANDLEDAYLKAGADFFATKPFATNQTDLKKFMLHVINTSELASRK